MLLFLCNFFLRKTSFPTEKIGRGIAAFAAFPCSPCGKSHFRKSCARFACYFFYAILSLGKLRFPRIKLHKKSKTPTGFYFSEKIYAEREGFEPPDPCGSTVFKTAAIDHSATSPRGFPISFIGLQIRLSHCFPSSLRLSSYCGRFLWARWGLNPRPSDYESPALTAELQAR